MVLLVLALVATACGSTSKTQSTDRTAGTDAVATEDSVAGSAVPGATDGPSRGRSRSSGTVGAPASEFPPAPIVEGGGEVRLGTGVTANSIKIGFNHSAPLGPAFAIVGFGGEPEGVNDERQVIDALVKYFNTHGGLAGRKIIPVYYEYDAASGRTWDSLAAEACQRFVNDEKVFVVASGHVGGTDALLACLAEGKTPLLQQNQWPYDGVYFREYANYLYQPSRMRPERWVPAYVQGLKDAGYFTSGYKLGLLSYDAPVFGRISKLIRAELAKRGLKLTREEIIGTPQAVADFGPMATQMQNATLRFRADDVTHIIFNEWAGQMPFFYLTVADDQDYHPRYGFTSVQLGNTQAQQHDASQLRGAIIVSWLPSQDVARPDDPRKGGAFGRCDKIFRDAGVAPHRLYNGTFCDSLFFLEATLSKTNDITPTGLSAAGAKLGTSYDSPFTWSTRFAAGRPDGASAVRIGRYNDGCGCFRYTTPDRPVG